MTANEIMSKKEEIYKAFSAVSQPRTNFQIKNFVVCEHSTPERQYMQCVTELHRKMSMIRRACVEQRKLLKKISEEDDEDEKELAQIDLEDISFAVEGAIREFETLYAIFQSMPKYTYEQLQDAEERYWIKRLSQQAMIDIESTGSISKGNLDALRQLGLVNGDQLFDNFKKLISSKEGIKHEMLQIPAQAE